MVYGANRIIRWVNRSFINLENELVDNRKHEDYNTLGERNKQELYNLKLYI